MGGFDHKSNTPLVYDHKDIEAKWQKAWSDAGIYNTPDEKKDAGNYYLLVEYPYPSGNLHIGHWYAFAVPDIFARKKRMQGFNVLFPIGFDSFGLPAENAAIKNNLDPAVWTNENIEYMTGQLERMGNSFDWSRKVITSQPEYYKWTQWLFLEFFKRELAYRKEGEVNWCPSCQTVLANEQVISGKCERCGADVETKKMKQWFLKITDYAEKLLSGLDGLDWPEEIKNSQRNWIGKREGSEISFNIEGKKEKIKVFTTRADTLMGVTYIVLAPEHPLLEKLSGEIENINEVRKYQKETSGKKELERMSQGKDKTGVELVGIKAVHPITKEVLPVFIADYCLASYGTGAVMAVPAHDERDFAFAKKHKLPIKEVIKSEEGTKEEVYEGDGTLINSGEFDGLESGVAKEKLTEKAGGEMKTTYKLRDWSVGRQRYWGCPIPIVYNEKGEAVPIPEEHLPWLLPTDIDFKPDGTAPLARSFELKERVEKIFGEGFTPEVETLDTFVDSSWYFLRYLDSRNEDEFSSIKKQKKWMPVQKYSGGAEHTTMHLLYSRFFYKALFDMGLVSESEPYKVRMNRGLVLGPDGAKMSKSQGNVVDPDKNVEQVGADTVKMYLAFLGPYNEVGQYPWDLGGISGLRRFLERVWKLQEKIVENDGEEINKKLHKLIKKVGEDIEQFKFNTAISAMMVFVNDVEKNGGLSERTYKIFLKVLAPFAPHMSEEIWHLLGEDLFIHQEEWPKYDEKMIEDDEFSIAVQINSKARGMIRAKYGMSADDVLALCKEDPKIAEKIVGKEVKRIVYVPKRVINIIVS
ncbi:MAG: leucine--tRNA ligase [Patescibacteria group bacterium]